MRRNICKSMLITVISVFLLPGCGDRLEIEKQAHVVVLGLDTAKKDNMVNVTFQIANPQVGSTERGKAENEQPSDIITFSASDITSAKELANSVVTRKLTFGHLQTMIISEKLARTPQFHHILASSSGDPEMRREINLIISKERARDFIHANKPKLETRPHKYYAFIQERWKDTGLVPIATIHRYFQRLQKGQLFLAVYATTNRSKVEKEVEDEDEYIAGQIPQKSGDPIQMIGSAATKAGRMIGTLTGEETRLALMLRRMQFSHSLIASFSDPLNKSYRISVRVLKEKNTKIDVNVRSDPPEVYVTVPLIIEVLSIPSLTDYVLNIENQKVLKRHIKKQLEQNSMKLIKKMQNNKFEADPFEWSLQVRRKFWTIRDYDRYEWEKKFPKAKVHVKYNLQIEGFGKQFEPPRIKNKMED